MWCKSRCTEKNLFVRFGDGEHCAYLESVCAAPCEEGHELCHRCLTKVHKPETQYNKTFPHGLVNGEFSKQSHIYDSPWYHMRLEAYGTPSDKDLELAMEAQRRARQGIKTKTLGDLTLGVPSEPVAITKPKERKTPAPSSKKEATIEPPKSETLTPQPTVAEQLAEAVVNKFMAEHKAVETMDDVLPVQSVIRVTLRPFTHNDVVYWRDAEREKIYRKTKDGKKGEYVGRWDAVLEKIYRDASDSDEDK
jgi:hypothetical protein